MMLQGARDHVTQRADLRDRAPSYVEPRGAQYNRYYPETSRDPVRGPTTARHYDATQTVPPGLMIPPWNNVPGQRQSCQCFVVCFRLRRTYAMWTIATDVPVTGCAVSLSVTSPRRAKRMNVSMSWLGWRLGGPNRPRKHCVRSGSLSGLSLLCENCPSTACV